MSTLAEAILDSMPTGVIAADGERRIRFANRAARELFASLGSETILGGELPADFAGSESLVAALRSLRPGEERQVQLVGHGDGGGEKILGATVMQPVAPESEFDFVMMFRDLSRSGDLYGEVRRVERLNTASNMISGLAHSLKNPLAALHGLVEGLLTETEPAGTLREYVRRMPPLIERMNRLIGSYLRVGWPRRPARVRSDPAALLQGAIEVLRPRWSGQPGVVLSVAPELPPAEVDPDQLEEVLVVLLDNALDAATSAAGVTVRVVVEETGQAIQGDTPVVRFDVCDDGPGISEEHLPQIFDPFFTTKVKGSGLGLPLAHALVRANGGRLLVTSLPGADTVFSIFLPTAQGRQDGERPDPPVGSLSP